jgi:hypothetical protein
VSSTYHILCLSHDPAIIVSGGEYNNAAEAVERAGNPDRFVDMAEHEGCDLLVGRYSYPLVEVGCPPRENSATGCMHLHAQWISIEWVRLLAASLDAESEPLHAAVEELTRHARCWSRQRIQRLRSAQ